MQRVSSTYTNETLPKIPIPTTKVSRLYHPYDPTNPTRSKQIQNFPLPHPKKLPKQPSIDQSILASQGFSKQKPKVETFTEDIKISVRTVISTPKTDNSVNVAFLTADVSTNNSSFNSNKSGNQSTPSVGKDGKIQRKIVNKPARFLSSCEYEEITQPVIRREFRMKTENFKVDSVDFMKKIEESDRKEFKNELIFRKFRKHRFVKLLPVKFEDDWEWSSHGSASPIRRVKFLDV